MEEPQVEENSEEICENENPNKKKGRKFYAKEFRQALASKNGYESVKSFIQLCSEENPAQDYCFEYLQDGGNCSEILRVIESTENRNSSFVLPVFQAFNIVLLKIISSHSQKQQAAEESCRELLNKHYSVIKSMLSLNSNTKQRKVALKLLGTMVTMSPGLAKEVLVHTIFERAILDVLTQPSKQEDGNAVRTSFIHFLLSFLIEGNTATIVTFLEKRGLLGSIFSGLIYDTPDTVNLVLSTLQTKILEDKFISKTIKMNTFNTQAVQSILNLYNWKGPSNWIPDRKKRTSNPIVVNQVEKEKVCDSVQRFLLVLCTSHKYGIVFHDPTLGLSNKNHNPLMLTVLKSLDKPWDHVYASELVIKICVACPDLVKHVLTSVEPYLEPRVSQKWINVVKFIQILIESLEPKCVEQFLGQLNIKQISLVIQNFCVPKTVVNLISTNTILHDDMAVRHLSILLLSSMLESIDKYLSAVNKITSLTPENKITLKGLVVKYLNNNLPPATVILNDWGKSVDHKNKDTIDSILPLTELDKHLSNLLDILYKYNSICPQLVDHITKELNTFEFLQTIEKLSSKDKEATAEMQVKAINLLLLCNSSLFTPATDLFAYTFPLLLKLYYFSNDALKPKIETTLVNLLTISILFEGCQDEIMIWLYSILEQDSYSNEIGIFLSSVFKKTNKNFLKYINELSSLKETTSIESSFDVTSLIENLKVERKVDCIQDKNVHVLLSPLIIGFLDELSESKDAKLSQFINVVLINLLHSQTSPVLLQTLVLQEKYAEHLPKNLIKYFKSWEEGTSIISLKKIYSSSKLVLEINNLLISTDEDSKVVELLNQTNDSDWKHYHCSLLSKQVMFFFTQLCSKKVLTESQQQKCLQIIIYLIKKCSNDKVLYTCLDSILNHPILLQHFTPLHSSKNATENICTDFVLSVIQELLKSKTKIELDDYLNAYRTKLVSQLHVMLKKCGTKKLAKTAKLMDVVKLLDLSYAQCSEVLDSIANLPSDLLIVEDNKPSVLVELISYTLSHPQTLNVKPFSNEIISKIGQHLTSLNKHKIEMNLENFENSLCSYIKLFPHSKASFGEEVFESLICKSLTNKSTIRLATLMLKSNKKFLKKFETHLDEILERRELVFSLCNALLNLESSEMSSIISKVYKAHEQIILKFLNKPQKVANYLIENCLVVNKLIIDCMSFENCKSFSTKSHKFDVSELYHAEILTNVYNKSITFEGEDSNKIKYFTNYINTIMNLLINLLKRAEKSEDDWNKIENITKLLNTNINKIKNDNKLEYNDETLVSGATFQTFSKLCLKFGLQGKPSLVNILKQLCEITESKNPELGLLFEMAVSHSESLNILLSENNLKATLLSLLLVLCKKCPSVMVKSHIPVWLGAYGATLSQSDQYLLQLMSLYEEGNIGFHEYRPYLWGKAAVGYYSVKSGVETTLWRQPKPREILDILDENKIIKTITYFPRSRQLRPTESLYSEKETDVYDPAFYLPLLSHLLVPESTIRWYQCTQRGIISLVIVALTSEAQEVRAAACHVLARFHSHIEATRSGKQRLLWQHLVEVVCRGTSTLDNLRLSTIAAVFLARCAMVFTRPNHPLYSALGHYFMARECPDFTVIPELLSLLHSTDVSHSVYRNFILEVIRDGLHTEDDLKVMSRSVAFKLLMDLHNSVLIDYEAQIIILQILTAAVRIPTGAKTLVTGYSIISWLQSVVTRLNETDHLVVVIEFINNLVSTYEEAHLKYIQFSVLFLLTSMIDHFKILKIQVKDLVSYVKILYKVYKFKPCIISRIHLDDLLSVGMRLVDCNSCKYYLEFGSKFVEQPILHSDDIDQQGCYYLELLTLEWIKTNKI